MSKKPTQSVRGDAKTEGQALFDSDSPFRKEKDSFRLRREVEAMEYVRGLTSIPIPRILATHISDEDDEPGWVLMERISGQQLGDAWPSMGEGAKARTITELDSYLAQLHDIQPSEPGWIGSCSGGPAYGHRIDNMSTCGPFASISDCHDSLVAPVKNCPRPELVDRYRLLFPDSHRIVIAHADISWENILIDPKTGAITGVIDWEMAGFWPEWWEFRKAVYASRGKPWWISIMRQVMAEYLTETKADMELEMY